MRKVHPFEPIWDKQSKILILGTLPSITSVEKGFYYMHPQNRFWKILSLLYDFDFYNSSIPKKVEELKKRKLALYDIILECDIEASKDSSIEKVKVTDIVSIIENSKIMKIVLNGKQAYNVFIKHYPKYQNMAFYVPSSSSANAAYSLEELVEFWRNILL